MYIYIHKTKNQTIEKSDRFVEMSFPALLSALFKEKQPYSEHIVMKMSCVVYIIIPVDELASMTM